MNLKKKNNNNFQPREDVHLAETELVQKQTIDQKQIEGMVHEAPVCGFLEVVYK